MKTEYMLPASNSFCSIVLILLGGFFPSFAFAASKDRDLDAFYNLPLAQLGKLEITSATGNSTPLDRAPAAATVITAEEIKAMGASHLDEVLESVPGLHVSLSPLSRLEAIYSIRGIHTGFNPHVLLLMNGVPVQFSVQGGRPVKFRYPVSNIARIEVIRGPGSAIYGADAYAGVINVITKDATMMKGFEAGVKAGSYRSREVWASGSGELNEWKLAYNVSYQASDGDDQRGIDTDFQTLLDLSFGTNASLAPGPLSTRYEILNGHISALSKRWTINMWVWDSNDSGLGAGGVQALDYNGGDDSNLFLIDSAYKTEDIFNDWSFQIRLNYQYYDTEAQFNLLPEESLVPIGADGNFNFFSQNIVQFPNGYIGNPGGVTEDGQLDLVSIYTGLDSHRFRFAQGVRYQSLNSRETKNFGPGVIDGSEIIVDGDLTDVSNSSFVFVKDTSRRTAYLSIQDEWHFSSDWDFTAGVRFDDYSDFGFTANPRFALIWAAHEKITMKLLYGSAFRAPSFSEQFNENNPVVLGNEDLDPEVIDTHELSLSYQVKVNLRSSVNLYYFQAKDMIEYAPTQNLGEFQAKNIRDQNGRGFEWELHWDVSSKIRIRGNYSFSDARDSDNNSKIIDAPRRQASFNANWDLTKGWAVNSMLNWVAGRPRSDRDLRSEIDDYTMLDLALSYEFLEYGVGVEFAVKNATNEDAREPSDSTNASFGIIVDDYPLSGRSFWMELSYQF